VTKSILEAITAKKDDSENLKILQNKLKEKLSKERNFFLHWIMFGTKNEINGKL